MRFIKGKNLEEREVLLVTPETHWMYIIQPLLLTLCILLLFPLIIGIDSGAFSSIRLFLTGGFLKHVFFTVIIAGAVWFLWRVITFICIEYGITSKRLIMKRGVLRLLMREIRTDRIESLTCVQGILGRLCNYGTVYVSGVGGTTPLFFMVKKPRMICRKINGIIEKNRAVTLIRGPLPAPPAKPPQAAPKPAPQDPYLYGTFIQVVSPKPPAPPAKPPAERLPRPPVNR